MTVYRVGADGATVFSADGGVVMRLRPGHVVVPGLVDDDRSLAAQHQDIERKRLARYADKRVAAARDYEDKAV